MPEISKQGTVNHLFGPVAAIVSRGFELVYERATPLGTGLAEADAPHVPEARRFVVAWLAAWGREGLGDVAAHVTSELVTNAFVHGRSGPVRVRGELSATGVFELRVYSEGLGAVCPGRAREDAESGRGLWLVEVLADAWDVDPGGLYVWCRLVAEGRVPW
ncbi:ATP-binding protein [Streptomyces sp. NPDC057638]|uniref:ATP-binding protein n=1 Tax=Streptomyces sp. NPDC057638 TaxID=3346190 RepID=UPI00367CE2D9